MLLLNIFLVSNLPPAKLNSISNWPLLILVVSPSNKAKFCPFSEIIANSFPSDLVSEKLMPSLVTAKSLVISIVFFLSLANTKDPVFVPLAPVFKAMLNASNCVIPSGKANSNEPAFFEVNTLYSFSVPHVVSETELIFDHQGESPFSSLFLELVAPVVFKTRALKILSPS